MVAPEPHLILATANPHKMEEILRMLDGFRLAVGTLRDHPEVDPGPETGDDFEANAVLKAERVARATHAWALADDSGLEVKALHGRPGVLSKRFAGPDATDADNNRKLLEDLAGVPEDQRQARFVTVMALARPGHPTITVRGEVHGVILASNRGDGGFGYDPLFYYPPYDRAFGELTLDQKNRISHRAAALVAMRERIGQLLNGHSVDDGHAGDCDVSTACETADIRVDASGPGPSDEGLDHAWTRVQQARRAQKCEERARSLEYVEAIVVAFIMALILREFFFEAFKIPTPSMAPTLRGAERLGDRILVDKFIYKARAPRRWEVIVFRYPLDQTTNYIKRLIGLPGEKVTIRDGDIWINDRIERKPRALQNGIWISLYPVSRDPYNAMGEDYRAPGRFETEERQPLEDSAWEAAPGAGQTRQLRFAFQNEPFGLPGHDRTRRYEAPVPEPHAAGFCDFRVDGTVQLNTGDAAAGVQLRTREVPYEIWFRAGQDGTTVSFPRQSSLDRDVRWPHVLRAEEPGKGRRLPVDRAVPISVQAFDYQLYVLVDDEVWFHYVFEPDPDCSFLDLDPATLSLKLSGGGGTWSDLAVFRDLHHTQNNYTVTVPPDDFFVLGDNTTNSKDSRRWRKTYRRLVDGTRIEYDAEAERNLVHAFPRSLKAPIVDVLGNTHPADRIDWTRAAVTDDAPFVQRELLIGRALFIFFPWPPFYTEEFRPGMIR